MVSRNEAGAVVDVLFEGFTTEAWSMTVDGFIVVLCVLELFVDFWVVVDDTWEVHHFG